VVIPYVRGVSEEVSRVLRDNNVKIGFKPLNVLRARFPRPTDKPPTFQSRSVVYKIDCLGCDFVYYGQTDRVGDSNSKVAQHANQFGHDIEFNHTTVVDKARDCHKRLFLEAWYSRRNRNAGNEHLHIDIPNICKSLTWFVMSLSSGSLHFADVARAELWTFNCIDLEKLYFIDM